SEVVISTDSYACTHRVAFSFCAGLTPYFDGLPSGRTYGIGSPCDAIPAGAHVPGSFGPGTAPLDASKFTGGCSNGSAGFGLASPSLYCSIIGVAGPQLMSRGSSSGGWFLRMPNGSGSRWMTRARPLAVVTAAGAPATIASAARSASSSAASPGAETSSLYCGAGAAPDCWTVWADRKSVG